MPIQRRIPKSGFCSRQSLRREQVYLTDLNKIEGDVVDLLTLKAANILRADTKEARIIGSGEVNRAITVRGITVTAGARKAIEAAKGTIEA